MQFISSFAIYFVIWWITLFAILPIGLRTQEEDGNVAPGTVASAPARFRGGKILLVTTLVAGVIYGLWYGLSWWFGFTMDDLPRIIPDYG